MSVRARDAPPGTRRPEASPSTVRRAVAHHRGARLRGPQPGRPRPRVRRHPRALQYAFRKHLGCTPQDYLRRVRLDLARRSLRDGTSESVSDAAARYGFFNPGRFASDYRQVFDENPRQTLHRARTPDRCRSFCGCRTGPDHGTVEELAGDHGERPARWKEPIPWFPFLSSRIRCPARFPTRARAARRRPAHAEPVVRTASSPASATRSPARPRVSALTDELIETNLDVARSIAGRYRNRGIDLDDLEQVALLGLTKAAQRFDPDAGHDFLSYAVPTVRGELRRHFRDAGWMIRPPATDPGPPGAHLRGPGGARVTAGPVPATQRDRRPPRRGASTTSSRRWRPTGASRRPRSTPGRRRLVHARRPHRRRGPRPRVGRGPDRAGARRRAPVRRATAASCSCASTRSGPSRRSPRRSA